MFALNPLAFTISLVMLWEILSASKNISEENIVTISNGFVRDALKVMLFNLITKLISKLVVLEDILVTVVVSSPGWRVLLNIKIIVPHGEFTVNRLDHHKPR
jgi:hypothetical protein